MGIFPLLTAKLFPPPYQPDRVPRTRLKQKLDAGIRSGRKYTLVSAPAGFGKTTLIVQWLESYQHAEVEAGRTAPSIGWFSLDPTDNDFTIFLRYLLSSLQSAVPGVGHLTQELLESGQPLHYETVLLPLLNDLFPIRTPFVLVLDDYHVIQDPAIHQAVLLLLERQPACMHTIIITRRDPLLPLARWRARGQLTDIRLGELRFSEVETAEFLNGMFGLNLLANDIAALEARTEGWIAGLQMAAISIQQANDANENTSEFIQAFAGDDRFVMDYLLDEVLNRQPQEVQDFLLKTSVLDRFDAKLCAALIEEEDPTEASQAQHRIAYLEEANLFLIPLDHRRQWYRYHHLFAELLRNRLSMIHGRTIASALQHRASRWCDDNGFPEQSIRYAQDAGDWNLAGQLIDRYSLQLIRKNEMLTLIRLVRPIPDSVIRQNPHLCKNYGYALTQCGQLTSGKSYLDLAEQGLQHDSDALGTTLIYSSFNALFRGNFTEQISRARDGLELLDAGNTWMRASANLSLGMGLLHNADPQNSELACSEALRASLECKAERTSINALSQLGRIAVLRLDFNQAEAYFQRAVQIKFNEKPFPAGDMPLFDLAMLKYEQNELDTAEEYTRQGLETNERSGSIEMRAYGFRLLARLQQLRGNMDEAREYLHKALKLSETHDLSPLSIILNAALQIQMALTDGDILQAEKVAPAVIHSHGVYPFMFYPETHRVQLLLVQKRKEEALQLLQPVLPKVELQGWEYSRLQIRVLQAVAADHDINQALAYLMDALSLAHPAGAVRVFLDMGEPVRFLLETCMTQIKSPSLRQFALQILACFPSCSVGISYGKRPASEQGLIEPLSEREIEVLQLLANGLSNAEIAQKLYLSPNTLKAHTQNIYSKLDVHSRLQATNKARELKIL
jgi:LuxR family transcriptional regulator, maltose regulon positive regulatory protein